MSAQHEQRVNIRDRLRKNDKVYVLPFNPHFLHDEFQGNTDMPKQDIQAWFISDKILPHLKTFKVDCLDVGERRRELLETLGEVDEWVDSIDAILKALCCRAAASIVRDDPKEGILSTYGQNSDWGHVAATRLVFTALFDLLETPKGFFWNMLGGKVIGKPRSQRRGESRANAAKRGKQSLPPSSSAENDSPPRSIKRRKQSLVEEEGNDDDAGLGADNEGGVPVATPTPTTARSAGAAPVNLAGNPAPAVSGSANPAPPPAPVAQMVPALPPYGISSAVDDVLNHARVVCEMYRQDARVAQAQLAAERATRQRLEVLLVAETAGRRRQEALLQEERAERHDVEVTLAEERADRQMVELRADPRLAEEMAARHQLEVLLKQERAVRQRVELQRDMAELQAVAAQSQVPIPDDADHQNPENPPQL